MIGEEPVAITKRRAAMVTSPATTVRGSIKLGFAGNDIHAETGEAFTRRVWCECTDDVLHVGADSAEIDSEAPGFDAKASARARSICTPRRGDESLCGNAAAIEALANLRLEFPFVVHHQPTELTAIETNAGEEYSRSRMTWNS